MLVGRRRADRSPGSRKRAAGPDGQLRAGVSVAEAGPGEDGAAPCAWEEAGGAEAKDGGRRGSRSFIQQMCTECLSCAPCAQRTAPVLRAMSGGTGVLGAASGGAGVLRAVSGVGGWGPWSREWGSWGPQSHERWGGGLGSFSRGPAARVAPGRPPAGREGGWSFEIHRKQDRHTSLPSWSQHYP